MATEQHDHRGKFEGKGLIGRCEACGQPSQWTVADEQYVLMPADGGDASRMPVYAMVCGNCGHVRLFNANVL
jgi:uncharacterized OB-fold protein